MGIVETKKCHKNESLICASTPFEYDKKPNGFDICVLSPCALEKKSPMELVEPYSIRLSFVASPTSMLV
jgi:hypothetical protein